MVYMGVLDFVGGYASFDPHYLKYIHAVSTHL